MRHREFLARRYRAVAAGVGLVLALTGATMVTPLLALIAWPAEAEHAAAFLVPAALAMLVGGAAWRRFRQDLGAPSLHEGGLIVAAGWLAASLVSAIPLALVEGMGPTRAVFESVSGWTTTGLSVLDVTAAARVTLLWRSVMQLVGGAGLAIVMLAALTRFSGAALGAAEGRGSQLVPNVRASARLVLRIYAGYAALGVLAYRAVGLGWFDAVNHAFAAVSTGGFSTRPESIGAWDSVAVEAVTIALMLLGNLSFVTAWLALRGQWRAVLRDGEVRVQAVVLPIAASLLFAFTTSALFSGAPKQLRVAVFESVSALTTTGFSTVGYTDWDACGVFVLIVLMWIGGGTCSTAGGLKQFRIYLLWMALRHALGKARRPQRAVTTPSVQFGGERVALNDAAVAGVALFVFLYAVTLMLGTFVLVAHGYSLQSSLFEFASSLGTVGLSIGVTTPTTAPGVLWSETVAMFLGRLEFFVVLFAIDGLVRDGASILRARTP